MPQLERAKFKSVHNLTEQDIIEFLNNCPNLNDLELSKVSFDLRPIIPHLANITSIDLSGSTGQITAANLTALTRSERLKYSVPYTDLIQELNDLVVMELEHLSIVIEGSNNLSFFGSCRLLRKVLVWIDEMPNLRTFEFGQLNIYDFDTSSFATDFTLIKSDSDANIQLQCGEDIYSIEKSITHKNGTKIVDKYQKQRNMESTQSSSMEKLPRSVKITDITNLKSMENLCAENVIRLIIHLNYSQKSRVVADIFKLAAVPH